MLERFLGSRRVRQIQRAFRHGKITILCLVMTVVVLRGTMGAGKFGTPEQDFIEIRDHLYSRKRAEPHRVLEEAQTTSTETTSANANSYVAFDPMKLSVDEEDDGPKRDPNEPYSLGPKITDWDEQRSDWLKENPSFPNFIRENKPRVLLVTGSSPKPCENPVGDHYLLKSIKNKIDYCRLHAIEVFYNFALLDAEMAGFWAKLPLIRKLLLSHPEVEFLWWMDSDAMFTDMAFEIPWERYKDHNFVMHGWNEMVYDEKNWIGLNTGSFLLRNCQWTLDILDVWAPMGPKGKVRDDAGKILTRELKNRPVFEADDQSAMVYILATQKEKWGDKVYLENHYYLHGYWGILVDNYEEYIEKYHPGLGDHRWPLVTHFVGCKPCGKFGDYSVERCLTQMDRAFNFGDNQILQMYGFTHQSLSSRKVKRIRNETDNPLEVKDEYGLLHPSFKAVKMLERWFGPNKARQIQRGIRHGKITVLCLFMTVLVLRGTIGAGKFGTPEQDFLEIRDHLYFKRAEPHRVLTEISETTDTNTNSYVAFDPMKLAVDEEDDGPKRDPNQPYSLGPKITDWDEQRGRWLEKNPSFPNYVLPNKPRVLLVTGSSPKPCENPVGDHYLLKSIKNKIDYCRLHGIDVFYNFALLDAEMAGFWAKLPLIRKLLLSHPEVEFLWWMDSDAMFTDMAFEIPWERYREHNFVMHGWKEMVYDEKNWIGLNTGSFLLRNCQWTLDLLDAWAPMGPKGKVRDDAGKILTRELKNRPVFEADDQSAMIYILATQREKWGDKVYLENHYYLHGYWGILVDNYEEYMEKYHPGLGDHRWPLVTHFVGCKPCGKFGDYSVERCLTQMDRAFNFGDNQILQMYGFTHQTLSSRKVKRIRNETDAPLEVKDELARAVNGKIILLCLFTVVIVLCGTIGSEKFGSRPKPDFVELQNTVTTARATPATNCSSISTSASNGSATLESIKLDVDEEEDEVVNLNQTYSLGPKVSDWDKKRSKWLRKNPDVPNFIGPNKPRVLLVSGSSPKPCETPFGDHYQLKSIKNKIDYCRLHKIEIFYNFATLDAQMDGFWSKLPLIRKLLLTQPGIEFLWWMDSDAMFTDMTFEIPWERYKDHNLVLHGWDEKVYNEKHWVGLNTGSFLLRNCQWTLDLLDAWAAMGPKGMTRVEAGKVLTKELTDRPDFEADDQSAMIYLLVTQREKWGDKVYLESAYFLHGFWDIIVDRYEEMVEKYHPGLGDDRWPLVTHFVGCKPCGKYASYPMDKCLKQMDRAFNFGDNQILQMLGFTHKPLDSWRVKRIQNTS
ncbi:hypothetical protein C5167_020943 [Papaver somniferum]|uniref:Xyloglucan 6-xylosyltransferase n=1 Tax=Papaver somniferum TaxID=3469 RepID=A0A4Y7IV06_PAPSO|nr:hypothetical protein C5167_020943 [Papaver somniferum]